MVFTCFYEHIILVCFDYWVCLGLFFGGFGFRGFRKFGKFLNFFRVHRFSRLSNFPDIDNLKESSSKCCVLTSRIFPFSRAIILCRTPEFR